MKVILIITGIAFSTLIQAQVITRQPINTSTPATQSFPVRKNLSPTAPPQPTLVEGQDLVLKIDRVDDNSSFEMNKYTVWITITNRGNQQVRLDRPVLYMRGTIKNTANDFISYDGFDRDVRSIIGKTEINPGESFPASFSFENQVLLTNQPYKYSLTIDSKNRLSEYDKNNNTAEAGITAHAIKNADYYLASAKLSIQTGNDNKEADNSGVYFYLGIANYNAKIIFVGQNAQGGEEYTNEMKVNSTTEIALRPDLSTTDMKGPYNSLCFYKQRGMALTIIYNNKKWATDAWKINSVTVTLTFADKAGNPYPNPAYAVVTIPFNNINGLLGYHLGDDITSNSNQVRELTLGTDQNFNPLPPEFFKQPDGFFLLLNGSPLKNAPVIYCR